MRWNKGLACGWPQSLPRSASQDSFFTCRGVLSLKVTLTLALTLTHREAQAWELTRALGADYVVVVFGGLAAYQSDDLNKLVWMCRLADEHFPTQPR